MSTAVPSTIDQHYLDTGQAFDSVAADYDGPLGNNLLVQHMRSMLWQTVESLAPPGARLLDLGCGTGLDALHFAQQGYRVTAIDQSEAMVEQTSRRAQAPDAGRRLSASRLGIQELDRLAGEMFDVIYSDLGALNCLPDPDVLAQGCDRLLRYRGYLVFSVIGRYCPWELAYFGLRGDGGRAWVRFTRGQVPVSLNGHTVWTRYYTPREFYDHFGSRFEWRACRAVNLFLPPPYLIGFAERHPSLLRLLAWFDEHAGGLPLLSQAGDHFLLVMRRRG